MNDNMIKSPVYTIVSSTHTLAGRGGRLRKRGGQVVSFAPQMLDLCAGASRVALGGLLVLGGMFAAAPAAMAGTCDNLATSVCSGPADPDGEDVPVDINLPGSNITVTTAPGFGIDTSDTASTAAIILTGNNVTFTDNNQSAVTGQQQALVIQNGAGSATVTSTGSLTGGVGGVGSGLVVANAATGNNVTINVNDVQGQLHGILVNQNGFGDTSVTATGAITSLGATGVLITTDIISDDVTVSVADVTAQNNGITVNNNGDGITSVTASGTVTSNGTDAIFVNQSAATAGDVIIAANNLDAGRDGIRVFNNGGGALNIDVTGTIEADELGINAFAGPNSSDVTINVNTINSIDEAIRLQTSGSGDVVINATGPLTSTDMAAIGVNSGAATGSVTITTTGAVSGSAGLSANHYGSGPLVISNSESVTATGNNGVFALVTGDGGIDIDTVDVTATSAGILAINYGDGNTSITSTGTISSDSTHGVQVFATGTGNSIINTVDVNAANGAAIAVQQFAGDIDITSTGTLNAETGVAAFNGNAGGDINVAVNAVNASSTGIIVDQNGTGGVEITASGDIVSTGVPAYGYIYDGNGIEVNVGSDSTGPVSVSVDNITANGFGIRINSDGAGQITVDSTGLIQTSYDDGVRINAYSGAAVEVNVNNIDADGDGIRVEQYGDGDVNITATGDIIAGSDGIDVDTDFGSNANVVINAVNITADDNGIEMNSDGDGDITIAVTGLINSTGGDGIRLDSDGDGNIDIAVNDITADDHGLNIDHFGSGTLTITSTGTIAAGDNGIDIYADFDGGNIIINANNITTDYDGIQIDSYSDGDITIGVSGLIESAYGDGINLNSNGDGNIDIAVNDITADDGDAVNIDHYGSGTLTITSTGTLAAYDDGISVYAGNNAGDIVINANNIDAGDEGVIVVNNGDNSISLTAANISGDYRGINIDQAGTGSVSVEVSGTINAAGANYGGYTYGGTGVDISSSGDVDLQVNDVNAYANGIIVSVTNAANADIVANGTITAGDTGILGATNGGDLTITANNVTAGNVGIQSYNIGAGDVEITVNGVVEGGNAAILAIAAPGSVTTVQNDGTLRNSDGLSTSLAIVAANGSIDLTNNGLITGSIIANASDDAFVNNGTWNNVGGTSDFGGGSDLLTNSTTGIILGASNAATAEVTTIVGLANLQNNGLITLADGAAGDVFRTDGNAAFSATSTLRVDVSGAGNSDLFEAAGDVVLSGGELDVNLIGALPTIGTQYTVLQGNSVTGTFDFDDQYYTAFLGLRDSYTPTSVVLNFTQLRALSDAGLTPNQIATADGLDSLPITNGLLTSVLYLGTDAAAQSAFDQLSGDIHPGARTALAEDSRLPRNAVLERLSNPEGGAVWGQLFWNTGDSDGNRNTAPIKRETWGFIAGADVALGENAVIGVSGAYLSNDLDQRQRTSDGKLETIHVLGYVGAQAGQFRVKAGVGYAWGDIETTRNVSFTGFSDKLTAEYDATLFQAFAEAGVQVPVGGGYIEPIAQVAFLRAKTDGFTEVGGLAALTAQREVEKSTISTIGARFSTSQSGSFSVGGLVGWQHSYGSLNPLTRFNFAGSDSFSIAGVPQSRNAGVANIEARFQLSPGSSIGLGYDGVLGTASQDHAAKLSFRFAF